MGIARRRLDVAVPEELADHRKALAEGQGAGRKAVPEVVNSPIFQAGVPMDALPRLLKMGRC